MQSYKVREDMATFSSFYIALNALLPSPRRVLHAHQFSEAVPRAVLMYSVVTITKPIRFLFAKCLIVKRLIPIGCCMLPHFAVCAWKKKTKTKNLTMNDKKKTKIKI